MPWSENLVRGMQVLSEQAVETGADTAYGLSRAELERAVTITAEMRARCQDGVYVGPVTPEIYITLAPLRVAAIEAGYRWLHPLPREMPPARQHNPSTLKGGQESSRM